MADRKAELRALQAALAGVHAAIWGYGVLAPRLTGDALRGARKTYDAYRDLRTRLEELITARNAEPTAAEAAYRLPFPVTDGQSARRLARHLEAGCAAVWADLVAAAATGDVRTFAAGELTECTRRGWSWGEEIAAFPGLPERA